MVGREEGGRGTPLLALCLVKPADDDERGVTDLAGDEAGGDTGGESVSRLDDGGDTLTSSSLCC